MITFSISLFPSPELSKPKIVPARREIHSSFRREDSSERVSSAVVGFRSRQESVWKSRPSTRLYLVLTDVNDVADLSHHWFQICPKDS